jgi:phosphoribosylformylglycinamidine (FGAM) synthase-like enzyme
MYVYGNTVLIACDSGFVYSTDDFATTPVVDNSGLSGTQHQNLARIKVTSNYIVACTRPGLGTIGGVFRRSNSQFAGIKENELTKLESVAYPNPSNDRLTIEVSDLMMENNCSVKLTDMLGRDAGIYPMSEGKVVINVSNVNKGMYSYTVLKGNVPVSKGKAVVQ